MLPELEAWENWLAMPESMLAAPGSVELLASEDRSLEIFAVTDLNFAGSVFSRLLSSFIR